MYRETSVRTTKTLYWPNVYRRGGRALSMWGMLLFVLGCIVFGIVDVLWGLEFSPLFFMVVLAISLQWVLSDLKFPPLWAGALSGVFGVVYVLLRAGHLGDLIALYVKTLAMTVWQSFVWLWKDLLALLAWLWQNLTAILTWIAQWDWDAILVWPGGPEWAVAPNWQRVIDLVFELSGRLAVMVYHSWLWLQAVAAGEVILDSVSVAIVWGLLIWLLVCWAGWATRRLNRPLIGILPITCVMGFVVSYTGAHPFVFFPLVFGSLLLMAMASHREREQHWRFMGIDFVNDLWNNLFVIVGGLSLALMILSMFAPSKPLYTEIADWLDDVLYEDDERFAEDVAESLGLETQPQPTQYAPSQIPAGGVGLPNEHSVGPGPSLSRRIMFMATTGDVAPLQDMPLLDYEPPFYRWRSFSYDTYTAHGWVTTRTEEIDYEAGVAMVDTENLEHHRVLRQTIRRTGDHGNIVHATGALASVDQPYQAVMRSEGDLFGATADVRVYNATALAPMFTELELRSITETTYPDWVTERYLQLPAEVPTRVLELAEQITADIPTAYDRARSIESFMRTFSYTLDVPAPPPDREVADYFLFDLQQGYCDYYATTMAVLARAVGLPSRVVMGFSGGDYDPVHAEYFVYESDAHAWVEVYFPGYGWIEFEPTSGEPAIDRVPGSDEDVPIPTWPKPTLDLLAEAPVTSGPKVSLGWVLLGLAGTVVAFVAGFLLLVSAIESTFLLLWGNAARMCTRLYHHLRKRAVPLHVSLREGDTPYEFAAVMGTRITEIAGIRRGGVLLEPACDEVRALVEGYVQAWYAPHSMDFSARRALVWVWWKLRWRLWLAWLWRKTNRKGRKRAPMPGASMRPIRPAAR